MDEDGAAVKWKYWLSAQRKVAPDKYYDVSDVRFDTVVFVKKEYGRCSRTLEKKYICWFARPLCFLRIKKPFFPSSTEPS